MVKIEEVQDEAFARGQPGPTEDDEDWDTESEPSSEVSSTYGDETLAERISALRDVISPTQRRYIASSVSSASSWVKSGLQLSGKGLWLLSTSLLLLGVPWALAFADEQQMIEMEREMKAQQAANEILVPGSTSQASEVQPEL